MDYKITKYSPLLINSFVNLLDNSFKIKNKDKTGLVNWKLFNGRQNQTITYVALDNTNTVVAQYTNFPIKIADNKSIYNAMMCADMTTHIKHRGKGLISILSSKVYEEVTQNKYDFSIGFSNNEGIKVDKNLSGYGYKIVGKFVRYFKLVLYKKKTKHKLKSVNSFHKNFTFLNESNFLRINKDYTYLLWRYIQKPNSEYSIFSVTKHGSITGYVILRFYNKKCYVYDIITNSVDKNMMIDIIHAIENKALGNGYRIVVYNVLDNTYWQNMFKKFTYLKKSNNSTNYYLTVKIHNRIIPADFLLNKENWLLFNGDIL